MIHIPAGIRSLLEHPVINWNYSSEPEEGSGGRRIHLATRQGLGGGSSSINVYALCARECCRLRWLGAAWLQRLGLRGCSPLFYEIGRFPRQRFR